MDHNLSQVIEQVGKEKGINREILIDALQQAILTAARRKLGADLDLEARYNDELGEVELFKWVRVVGEVENPEREIGLEDARARLDPDCDVDDELGEKLDTSQFGRVAAQTAKQVIIQRIRDAERELVFSEYKDRKGELVTGLVRRFERSDIIVDLGRAEATLPRREQVIKETYRTGDRIQAFIKDVNREGKGPIITLSRTDEGFLTKLFEMEVPEIYEGIVRVVSAAREPGVRAKIAVASRDYDVDPVGACVGVKGARVQAVVQELRGEKIDIVPYSEDPARFVCNAIAPAQVTRVIIDQENQTMELIVPDDQLSLAIGRKGQNVRLAARLSGWSIDIHSETDVARAQEETFKVMSTLPGVTSDMLETLFRLGYRSAQDIAGAEPADLAIIPGIGSERAEMLRDAATTALEILANLPAEDLAEAEEAEAAEPAAEGEAAEAAEPAAEGEKAEAGGEKAATAEEATAEAGPVVAPETAAAPASEAAGQGEEQPAEPEETTATSADETTSEAVAEEPQAEEAAPEEEAATEAGEEAEPAKDESTEEPAPAAADDAAKGTGDGEADPA